jgi:hypothetical protein
MLHRRLHRRLLGGGSATALVAATGAMMLGASLPCAGQTVIGNQTTPRILNPAQNPFVINSGTVLNPDTGDAITGNPPFTQWVLINGGTVGGLVGGSKLSPTAVSFSRAARSRTWQAVRLPPSI